MTTALRLPVALTIGFTLAATAWGCSKDDEDGGLSPSNTGGTSGGTAALDAGTSGGSGGTSGTTGAGGDDSGNGVVTESQCEEIIGLPNASSCGSASVEAEYRTANVMLVIDKSGSMTDQPEGFESDKWGALKEALGQALPEVAGDMNFGMILYPYDVDVPIPLDCSQATNCCSVPAGAAAVNVPIGPGAESVPAIIETLANTDPGGGTPTAVALEAAYQYYTQGDGAGLQGDKFVLLATDGGPNCNSLNSCDAETCTPNIDGQCTASNCCETPNGKYCLDDQSVIEQIEALASAGISTFVVGIPGTEQYATYLDAFAVAGGVPNPESPPDYYAVSAEGGVQALADTFTSITTHLVRSCDVALSVEPPNVDLVNVAVNCEVVPYDDGEGWEINPDDRTLLQLKGDTCDYIQSQGARRIDIIYGCQMIR